jgi:Na+-transporting NADH:ubiquinone oxidoreductase subunit C
MLKGERHPESMLDEHHVDGMSGATLTGNGLNSMLQNYFQYYSAFLKKSAKNKVVAL